MTSSLLLLVFVLLVAALAAGLALGWFLGTRGLQPLRLEIEAARRETEAARSEGENWRSKFSEAIVNLAAERKTAERAEALESELRQERVASASLSSRIAAFERGEEERQRAHDSQLAQLKDLETKLEARFGELAGRAIEGAHDLFLKRADARFNQAGEKHEEKLKALLQPVETTL
ncbi:MAG TPA: DNA recombination protein RmuC, partial [Allosphingosinicella sp.]|nr:DNA recombination protein RmuC [Allosphingosinicella sp.]